MTSRLVGLLVPSSKLSVIVSSFTLLAFFPSPNFCEPQDKKGKDAKDESSKGFFDDMASKAGKKAPPTLFPDSDDPFKRFKGFNSVGEFIKSELKDGGILSPVRQTFESGLPGQLGYGFLMGFSSGFCLKKVSKIVAFVVGGAFIFVQTLSFNGMIDVNYDGIQKHVETVLDVNKDGKVDIKDAEYALNKVQTVLSYNMPSGGGFAAGFFMGLRG